MGCLELVEKGMLISTAFEFIRIFSNYMNTNQLESIEFFELILIARISLQIKLKIFPQSKFLTL